MKKISAMFVMVGFALAGCETGGPAADQIANAFQDGEKTSKTSPTGDSPENASKETDSETNDSASSGKLAGITLPESIESIPTCPSYLETGGPQGADVKKLRAFVCEQIDAAVDAPPYIEKRGKACHSTEKTEIISRSETEYRIHCFDSKGRQVAIANGSPEGIQYLTEFRHADDDAHPDLEFMVSENGQCTVTFREGAHKVRAVDDDGDGQWNDVSVKTFDDDGRVLAFEEYKDGKHYRSGKWSENADENTRTRISYSSPEKKKSGETTRYFEGDRLVREVEVMHFGSPPATKTIRYDEKERPVEKTQDQDSDGTPETTETMSYGSRSDDQPVRVEMKVASNFRGRVEDSVKDYVYDRSGNLIRVDHTVGSQTYSDTYAYEDGNEIERKFHMMGPDRFELVKRKYDESARIIEVRREMDGKAVDNKTTTVEISSYACFE